MQFYIVVNIHLIVQNQREKRLSPFLRPSVNAEPEKTPVQQVFIRVTQHCNKRKRKEKSEILEYRECLTDIVVLCALFSVITVCLADTVEQENFLNLFWPRL